MNARAYGVKAYTCRTVEELRAALKEGRKQAGPVLYDIKVLPGSMTPGYDSWWRVGVAEVSTQPAVRQAYEAMRQNIARARKF